MKIILPLIFFLLCTSEVMIQGCGQASGAKKNAAIEKVNADPFLLSDEFKNYWYAGKAEISSYKLEQARYGEIHSGYATAIFVTEDFSKSKQVKLDHPENAAGDKLPVLKLNLVKKFVTGIYPYSMMLSVFSPVDINAYPHAVKTTASVQEWCGMTYSQLNARNGKNEVQGNSYFEEEGDQHSTFETCIMEDELWSLIRIAPEKLPSGEQKVLPGMLYTRLTHIPLAMQTATLTLKEANGKMTYSIDYSSQKHTINIYFEKSFPHKILGWDETFPGFDGKLLTTTARLDKILISDYWVHHTNADRAMRTALDLPENF